jgi:hypothetical protein
MTILGKVAPGSPADPKESAGAATRGLLGTQQECWAGLKVV